jgi:hypothetical protein
MAEEPGQRAWRAPLVWRELRLRVCRLPASLQPEVPISESQKWTDQASRCPPDWLLWRAAPYPEVGAI